MDHTKTIVTLAAIAAVACIGGAAWSAVLPVGDAEQKAWIDCLIPLPKEVQIEHKQDIPAVDIFISVHPQAGDVAQQAVAELRALFGQTNIPAAGPGKNSLTIVLGLADADNNVNDINLPEVQRLRPLPNREQAYLIRPTDDRTLVIAALDERGLYYGVQTLKQLAAPYRKGEQAVIPMATITDWPDMAERGTWNASIMTPGFIPWLAGFKLNFEEFAHGASMDPNKEPCPPLPIEKIKEARARAFLLLPHSPHYDFWVACCGKYYPTNLLGKGDSARNPRSVIDLSHSIAKYRCPCASNPLLPKYLTEWMVSAAKQGVREVSMWLTEYQPCYCSCEKCLLPDGRLRQLQLETAATVKAIKAAQKTYLDLVVRILLTEQSAWHLPVNYWSKSVYRGTNDCQECLALVPDDKTIKVEKMYRADTACEAYAKAGHWFADYHGSFLLGIDWWWRGACPFRFHNAPENMRNDCRSWVAKGYSGSHSASCIGDGDMEKNLSGYALNMFAEWSWNSSGRSPREFNRAWLARQGYADIDKALVWLDAMSRLEQAAVCRLKHLKTMGNVIRGHITPKLEGPGFEGATAETAEARFDVLIASARKAHGIAEEIKAPDLRAEAEYVAAALEVSRVVYRLAVESSRPGFSPSEEQLAKVHAAFQNLALAAGRSLDTWKDLPPTVREHFAKKTKAYSDDQMAAILAAVTEAGGSK